MKPTKLDVFKLRFDVDTPHFLKEAAENCNGGMYTVCWNIFAELLTMVATRATELNDPIMDVLMLRLGMYDVRPMDRSKTIDEIRKRVEELEG